MYKKKTAEESNTERLGKSSLYAIKLAEKVRAVAGDALDNDKLGYSNFVNSDGCLFSKFDIEQLDKIGSLHACINIQRSVSGEDALLDRLDANMRHIVMSEALGHTTKEALHNNTMDAVKQLAQNTKA